MKRNTGFLVILAGLALGLPPAAHALYGEGPAAGRSARQGPASREFSSPAASRSERFRLAMRLLAPFRPADRLRALGTITAPPGGWRSPIQNETTAFQARSNRDAGQLRRWIQLEDIFHAAREDALNRTLHPGIVSGNPGVRQSSRGPRILRWVRFRPARPEPPAPPDTVFTDSGVWARERGK